MSDYTFFVIFTIILATVFYFVTRNQAKLLSTRNKLIYFVQCVFAYSVIIYIGYSQATGLNLFIFLMISSSLSPVYFKD